MPVGSVTHVEVSPADACMCRKLMSSASGLPPGKQSCGPALRRGRQDTCTLDSDTGLGDQLHGRSLH